MPKGDISISCADLSPRVEKLKEVPHEQSGLTTEVNSVDRRALDLAEKLCVEVRASHILDIK